MVGFCNPAIGLRAALSGSSARLLSMEPLSGMSVVGEFDSKFDADLAVAMLGDAGLEGAVMADPAHSVAPHLVTDPGFRVVVREEVAEDARELLAHGTERNEEIQALEASYHRRRLVDRPTWIRMGAWTVFWAIPGTFLVAGALFAYVLLRGLFP